MKLSYFTMPLHPPERNYAETLKEDREAFILADQLGYEEAFVGEHVTDRAETITSCLMFLASLATDTKNIKLGSGTVNLPLTHPVIVAAQVAMIDNLLEGRFLFGISPGGLLSDAEALGVLEADRNEMFVEGIDHVLALWREEAPYNLTGKYWNISTEKTLMPEIGQGAILRPYQDPHPPIVVTVVAPYSKGVTAAAARGWTPISGNFLLPQWVKTHWPNYAEGCEMDGRVADTADWRVAKSIFVAEDEKTALEYAHNAANSPYRFYYQQLLTKLVAGGRANLFKEDQSMADEDLDLDHIVKTLVIAGTAESVADQILEFRETVGDFGTMVYAGHDWVDPALGRRSMELMAHEVMPRVNEAIDKE
jgi:alkanesulfonate monooxygenase SsuD/methylene tetrahydromethanopterin reductase-like flavin-dependent oxidoreductase (luciferase family)